ARPGAAALRLGRGRVCGAAAARRVRAGAAARRRRCGQAEGRDDDGRMRFAIAHKVATYLMVGFAYVALIAGGGVSPVIALGGVVGLVASWWWESPLIRVERWTLLWTIGSIIALIYGALTAVMSGDFLEVGAQFLIWLIVAKAFNRRSARDWQQMYLL